MMGHGHVHRPNLPRQLCQRLISQDARIGGNVSAHVSGMDVDDMTFDPELLAQLADETGIFIRRLPQMVVNVADDWNEAGFCLSIADGDRRQKHCHGIRAPAHAKDDADFALPIILQHPALAELSLDFGDERMSPSAHRQSAGRSPSPRLGSAGAALFFHD